MKRIYDYEEASNIALHEPKGTFGTKDGKILKGPIIDIQDQWNDPNGIGYISILTDPVGNYGKDVNPENFAWAEFED